MNTPLQTAAISAVESLINGALAYDPVALGAIARLQGKVLHINCNFPPLSIFVSHNSQGLHLHSQYDYEPDTRLNGNAAALAGLAINNEQLSNLSDSGISIEGDHELLTDIRAILQGLDVDWETALAQLIGDVPAYILGNTLRSAANWGATARNRVSNVAAGFVQEEVRMTPAPSEMAQFVREVTQMRSDTDRLAARIQKLSEQLNPPEKAQ